MNHQTEKELLNIVKQNYSAIAADFNETRKKYLWPEIAKLLQDVKVGSSLLDVGCGNGRLVEALKDSNINYLGIDSCPELIKLAQNNYQTPSDDINKDTNPATTTPNSSPNSQLPTSSFLVGDILELSKIPELNFDCVACIAVLHHLPGRQLQLDALKQLKNKVAPNGRIIITTWNLWQQKKFLRKIIKFYLLRLLKKNKMDFGDILFDWQGKDKIFSQRYYHAFTSWQLKSLAHGAGLKIEKLYQDKFNYYLVLKK